MVCLLVHFKDVTDQSYINNACQLILAFNKNWYLYCYLLLLCPFRCLRQDVRPGLQSLGAVYTKSPRVPGLSFPFSYRDSTFLSIFAVPNNAVFWLTSTLTFTPIIVIITIIIIIIIIIIMLLLLLCFEVHVKQSLRHKSKTNISPLSLILFPSLFDIQEQNSPGLVPITKLLGKNWRTS